MTNRDRSVTFMGVGDIILGDPPDAKAIFSEILPTFRQADILFGQCECCYSTRGELLPQARSRLSFHPRNVEALQLCGFDVMSLCSNHSLDMGFTALRDTIENLKLAGIRPLGVGENFIESRRSVIVEKSGVKMAFLAYSPAQHPTFCATASQLGNNPMQIYNYYRDPEPDYPGSAPEVITVPDRQHIKWMQEDVAKAKEEADVVAVSFHWGLPFIPHAIADYESELGHAAVDAGADLVIGHHQHLLKGVELYKGKVIFHGINHLTVWIDYTKQSGDLAQSKFLEDRYGDYFIGDRVESSNPFHPDANNTIIVKAEIRDGKISWIGFIPAKINDQSQPVPTRAGDGKFEEVVDFLTATSRVAGFDPHFVVEGDAVCIVTS